MTAPSPGIVATTLRQCVSTTATRNISTRSRANCATNTSAIHDAGLILQIDAPDLAMERTMTFQDLPDARIRENVRAASARDQQGDGRHSARPLAAACAAGAIGKARMSTTCRSRASSPMLYKPRPARSPIEFANPRHAHEYDAIKRAGWPKDKMLIPGVIETTSNFVEHPRGRGAAHRRSGVGGRRPRARHCLDRLRLRHLCRTRMGGGLGGVEEACSRCAKAPTSPRRGYGAKSVA